MKYGTLATVTPAPLRPLRLPGLTGVPHPLPYQGSKRRLAHVIVPLLPPDTDRLLEPFAGSAAVALAARHLHVGRTAWIGDINAPLVALWRRILDHPLELAAAYQRMWEEQHDDPGAYFAAVRDAFNHDQEPDRLLYLLARCVKAAVRYNNAGQFNQGADHRRMGARPEIVRQRLVRASATLAGSFATVSDYRDVLAAAMPADVVYLDPPYQGVSASGDHRYVAGVDRAEFVAALTSAVERGVSFVASYDGRSGTREYGDPLPAEVGLHLHVLAGTSSQATLNGTTVRTIESIYVSPALTRRWGGAAAVLAAVSAG
jgi:DNA adenine methylase